MNRAPSKKKKAPAYSGHPLAPPSGLTDQLAKPSGYLYSPVTDALSLPGVDPAITYSAADANLGLGYANQDYNTQYGGFQTGPDGQPVRPTDLSTASRALQDYFRNFDRTNQDYGTQTADLNRSYTNLGENQLQSINAAGELGGGALAQALAKRTANQAHDQSALDTAHTRTLADLLTGTTRAATDAYTGLQRQVGENSLYQGTLQQQAALQAGPGLVGNPNYEVVGNTIYTRMPDGTVKATAKTSTPPKPPAPKKVLSSPWGARGTWGTR